MTIKDKTIKDKLVTSCIGSSSIAQFDYCRCITLPMDVKLPAYLTELYIDELHAKTSKRRNQFLCGRYAAHLTLSQCSSAVASQPVKRGDRGEPLFPAGFVGSISHTGQFASAVAASSSDILAVGVDIENTDRTISPRLLTRIANPSDIYWTDSPASGSQDIGFESREICSTQNCDQKTIELFSMKESIYKAHFNAHTTSNCQFQQKVIAFKDIYIYPTNLPSYFHAVISSNADTHPPILPDSQRILIVSCNTFNNLTTSIAIIPRQL